MYNVINANRKINKRSKVIRLLIDERGLPRGNLLLCLTTHMVSWNSETGEVKTIEYDKQKEEVLTLYDEVGEINEYFY